MVEDIFTTRQEFQDLNKDHKLIWYTSFVTGNFRPVTKISLRPLLGFIRYALFEMPWRASKKIGSYDILFATIFIKKDQKLQDCFFSTFPEVLKDAGVKVALCGKIAHIFSKQAEQLPLTLRDIPYFCPTDLLTKIDMLRCLCRAIKGFLTLSYPLQTKKSVRVEMFQSFFSEVLIGLMTEEMLKKIVAVNPHIKIIHGFEGNTWETACAYATPKTFGLQHGVIMPDQYKLTAFPGRPMSKNIVTTGPKASQALAEISKIPADNFLDGWTLRHKAIYSYAPKQNAPEKINSVLVLMQGNEHKNGVLNLLKAVVKLNPSFKVNLRPHPAVPLSIMGIRSDDGFVTSTIANIHDDILAHDVCLYVSSTAALESIYLGVPVVHMSVTNGGLDPLFGQEMLHKSANTAESLIQAVKSFEKIQGFESDLRLARNYFEGYFRKPDNDMKDCFLKWINQ